MLINRGKVKIDILTGKATLYDTYKVILPERKIYFHNSIIEKKEKKGKVLSLDIAMQRLVFLKKKRKDKGFFLWIKYYFRKNNSRNF